MRYSLEEESSYNQISFSLDKKGENVYIGEKGFAYIKNADDITKGQWSKIATSFRRLGYDIKDGEVAKKYIQDMQQIIYLLMKTKLKK